MNDKRLQQRRCDESALLRRGFWKRNLLNDLPRDVIPTPRPPSAKAEPPFDLARFGFPAARLPRGSLCAQAEAMPPALRSAPKEIKYTSRRADSVMLKESQVCVSLRCRSAARKTGLAGLM